MKLQRLNNHYKLTKEITIKGLVQGIGYRPFIAELASEMGLDGFVRNTDGIVTVVVCGDASVCSIFEQRILSKGPELAKVTSLESKEVGEEYIDEIQEGHFYIAKSNSIESSNISYIPPDIATCKFCERELFDENNRRYRHPFISCTDCGPRYSIIEDLPYDRPRITMKDFEFCEDCVTEYISSKESLPGNRRRHAQTIACKSCGPRLSYWTSAGDNCDSDDNKSIDKAVLALKSGKIVATMDIGGFHLACLASNDLAVKKLREIKRRKRKPFAVLFEKVKDVRQLATVNDLESELLASNARPVVLLNINTTSKSESRHKLSDAVCVNSPYLGAMLPCNPLQMILVKECGPLVMTSANFSGDLMIIDPEEMKRFSLGNGGEIEVLYHNRPILTPLDDSVQRVVSGKIQTIRRARGYVPEPILLNNFDNEPQMFATGGDMKATFCYHVDGKAYFSQPFGDMELEEVQIAYKNEDNRMKKLFGFDPKLIVCDKHPGYFTRKIVENQSPVEIYHHQAHVASVIAEHGLDGEVIGLAFDGTGYGVDGTVHGSEFYHWNGKKMNRFASLKSVKLQGGSEGVRNANAILAGFIEELPKNSPLERVSTHSMARRIIDMGINTVLSSSMGRLFDAASALLGICEYSEYEGEAAIELEYEASKAQRAELLELKTIEEDGILRGNSPELLLSMVEKLNAGANKAELALGFIYAIANWCLNTVEIYRKNNNIATMQIVLSGGTFQNKLLLEKVTALMEKEGYNVYTNEQISPGDGGLALGQLYLAR